MELVVCDTEISESLIARRRARGLDRYDEVWDGVYVMSPIADDDHQELVSNLNAMLVEVVARPGLGKVRPGVNVSDRKSDWTKNYRVPDAVVFFPDNPAVNHGTHWYGGPDWAAEIVSKGDRSRKKLDFYAKVGTRELLILDRDPWAVELYVLKRRKLRLAGRSTLDDPVTLESSVLPLSLRLTAGKTRPFVDVRRRGGDERWRV